MTVGQIIKEKRKNAGLTQKQLAEELGVATITIQQYERGVREPTLERLMSIARILKCSARDFIDEADYISTYDGRLAMNENGSKEQALQELRKIQELRILMPYRPLSDTGKERVRSYCEWVNKMEGRKIQNGYDAEHDIPVEPPQDVLDSLKEYMDKK